MQRLALALVGALVALALSTPSHATLNACSAGKKKCVAKKTSGLLKCHRIAETQGLDPVNDPTVQACMQKVRAKFDGGATPSKGCFAKLEAKFPAGCLTTLDTTALENKVDAFVVDAVSELDPGYPAASTNPCAAGKKKCVSKKAAALLKCHSKNEKPPMGLTPAAFAACLAKAKAKFDGGLVPAKGCFAKLEAKFISGCTTNDTATLEAKVDAFVDDVVCELDAGSGTCPGGVTPTPTPGGPTPTPTPGGSCSFVTKWGTNGTGDGQFSLYLGGVAVDGSGNVYVADYDFGANRIQKFDTSGTFLTKWGAYGNATGQFVNGPRELAVDGGGNVYAADPGNFRVQKFDGSGTFLMQFGTGGTGDGQFGYEPGGESPYGVAVDGSGNVFGPRVWNQSIQKFDASGTFLTKWGSGGSGDGQFQAPTALAADGSGNVFVTDTVLHRIQKFDGTGTFLTKWGSTGSGNGQFNAPVAVATDSSGNVYVADSSNNTIQKFTGSGTFLRKWGSTGSGDGQFQGPTGVAVDGSGNVYVADSLNSRIQKFACP